MRRTIHAKSDPTSQRGASSVEYGLILVLIAAVIVVAVAVLGSNTGGLFDCAEESIRTKATAC